VAAYKQYFNVNISISILDIFYIRRFDAEGLATLISVELCIKLHYY